MSNNSHPSRSSRSSRSSPSSSPLPSSQRHPPSDDFTSPTPANIHSPHPSANFMAGHSPVPPPSLSAVHYASFTEQHTYVDQCSIPRDPYHSSHPIASNPYPDPTTYPFMHPLQRSHLPPRYPESTLEARAHHVTVFVDSTGLSYAECSFVDPDDGVSEWRYRFCHSGPPKRIDM